MKRLLLVAALAISGALLASLVASSSARAWDVSSLPPGYSTAHWIDTSPPPGTCREGYNVQGYYASISLGLCDPAFQQKLDDFINSTCPPSACPPAAATTETKNTTETTTPVTTTIVAPLPAPPFADFAAVASIPGVVTFTDTSTGIVASRVWQFGDGTAATGVEVNHPYPPGVYYVTLIVVDPNGLTSLAVHQLTVAQGSIALGPRTTQAVPTTPPPVKKTATAAHRDPCHTRHSCPSDHHTYLWRGLSCTSKPGERTMRDKRVVRFAGLRYWCHRGK